MPGHPPKSDPHGERTLAELLAESKRLRELSRELAERSVALDKLAAELQKQNPKRENTARRKSTGPK